MVKNEEKVMEKGAVDTTPVQNGRKIVEVEYNGTSGWIVAMKHRGVRTVFPGEVMALNLANRYELRVLVQVLKQLNLPAGNAQMVVNKKNLGKPVEYRYRFVIKSGMQHIPEVLKKIQYRASDFFTQEEEEALVALCPDFLNRDEAKK